MIVALMVGVLVVGLSGSLMLARKMKDRTRLVAQRRYAQAQMARISAALENYSANNGGRYPDSLDELALPDESGRSYLGGKEKPRDPWGNEFSYEQPGSSSAEPTVYCLGADGLLGGEGPNLDIQPLEDAAGDR